MLFDWALPACLRFLRKEMQEISPTEDSGLARGAMRIIQACLDDFQEGLYKHSAGLALLMVPFSSFRTASGSTKQQLTAMPLQQPHDSC